MPVPRSLRRMSARKTLRETHDYGSAHAYAEAVRKWMSDVQAWNAVHYMMAMQMLSTSPTWPSPAQTGTPGGGLLPQPQATVTVGADGSRLYTAQYQIPSLLRRVIAEIIDCCFAFAVKLVIVYILVEAEIIDLDRYERLLSEHADLQTLLDITHELFPLEMIGKVVCSLLEAYLLSYGFGALPRGMTPGKSIMRIRVISCHSAMRVVGIPQAVTVTGTERVPILSSLQRSLFKNVLVNSLIPLSSIVYVFNHNRALYDHTAGTIVVSV